jgi:hypothetical protein
MNQIILRVGDELVMPGLFAHKTTYVGPIGPNAEDVLDPANGQQARFVHFFSIPNRERMRLGERGPEDYWDQIRVQGRAREVVARGIVNRPLGPNCEHICSYVRKGQPESPQLKVGVGLGLALLLLFFIGG